MLRPKPRHIEVFTALLRQSLPVRLSKTGDLREGDAAQSNKAGFQEAASLLADAGLRGSMDDVCVVWE
jgi:hypothetical protein